MNTVTLSVAEVKLISDSKAERAAADARHAAWVAELDAERAELLGDDETADPTDHTASDEPTAEDREWYAGWLANDEAVRETSEQYDDLRISGDLDAYYDACAEMADLDARVEYCGCC